MCILVVGYQIALLCMYFVQYLYVDFGDQLMFILLLSYVNIDMSNVNIGLFTFYFDLSHCPVFTVICLMFLLYVHILFKSSSILAPRGGRFGKARAEYFMFTGRSKRRMLLFLQTYFADHQQQEKESCFLKYISLAENSKKRKV